MRGFSGHYSYKYPVDFDDLTIEHIYPQSKIDNEWTENIVGCLGNLIFLDEKTNSNLDSKSFSDKKLYLAKESYSIPNFVESCADWTPELVVAHAEQMAEIAYKEIWKI